MNEPRNQLDPETQLRANEELTAVNRSFEELISIGHKLTQHNFLVNAGGAAAVLAYIGSTPGAGFAMWPLACFLVGVVATGVELRSLATFFEALHKDAIHRRAEFRKGKLDLSDAVPPPDLGRPTRVHYWSRQFAQWAFPVGVTLGVIFYLLH